MEATIKKIRGTREYQLTENGINIAIFMTIEGAIQQAYDDGAKSFSVHYGGGIMRGFSREGIEHFYKHALKAKA